MRPDLWLERLRWLLGDRLRPLLTITAVLLVVAALLDGVGWGGPGEVPEVGSVATRDLVAGVSFSFEDEEATRARQLEAEAAVMPVFVADLTQSRRVENRLAQAFDMARRRSAQKLAPEEAAQVRRDFVQALGVELPEAELSTLAAVGYAASVEEQALELLAVASRRDVLDDRAALPSPRRPLLVRRMLGSEAAEEVVEDYAQLRSLDEARQAVSLHVLERYGRQGGTPEAQAAAALARALVTPSLRPDPTETAARRAAAAGAVEPVEHQVRRGTRILRAGDVVTPQQARMARGLQAAHGVGGGRITFGAWLGFAGLVILTGVVFARATVRKFATGERELAAMAVTLVLVLATARVLAAGTGSLVELGDYEITLAALLVPVAGGAMIVRILVNSESALVWSIVASLLTAAMMDQSALLSATYVVTALSAAAAAGQGRERLTVLRAGVVSGLIGSGMVLLTVLVRSQTPGADAALPDMRGVLQLSAAAFVGGVVSACVALGSIPAFELLGFTTDYRLLELANLNHPLLRQLMLRAPGTYHHSVIVGSLSEAACEAIGANALLARVACYFHDIGKGLKPQYFVENQRDTPNRHDRLSPQQSAQVIIQHVVDGGALAAQHKLPKPVADQIYMHHGTGIIQYFYNKAREGGEPVDEALFRYPGPKPDSREAGIIMLADKVEAACRTIREPTETRIRAMIQQITNSVMVDGQFELCPLTLKELYAIADAFTVVLLGIYHHRIEYPSTAAIARGALPPVPRQGTITLEVMNPLKPPPPGSGERPVDWESAEQLPGGRTPTLPIVDDS